MIKHFPENAKQVQGYLISDKMTYDLRVELQIKSMESTGINVNPTQTFLLRQEDIIDSFMM